MPSSATVAPSYTVWSVPASAVGASSDPAVTVMATVSGCESVPPAVTVSENVNVAFAANCVGATKLGRTAPVELNSTSAPPVWLQA